ncbi:MAG: hypothetical protein H6626_07015 [Pseudobdellovibrionaceae bacterium]|nr:MAG: hypothetical protein H6626_07015 [Pseudobdellovibrionaceae bacterium]
MFTASAPDAAKSSRHSVFKNLADNNDLTAEAFKNFIAPMAYKTLYKGGSLGAGSHLWIVPALGESKWSRNLDWYCNFQMHRAHHYQPKTISEELATIIKDEEIPVENFVQSSKVPLLISCAHLLPTKMLVELPDTENCDDWCESAHRAWTQLGQPSLRIFLPKNISVNEFADLWPGKDSDRFDITLVPSHEDL